MSARALVEAPGRWIPVVHSTDRASLAPGSLRPGADGLIWFGNTRKMTGGFGANDVRAWIRIDNPFVYEDSGYHMAELDDPAFVRRVRAAGHDGIVLRNQGDDRVSYAVFSPEQVKADHVVEGAGAYRFYNNCVGWDPDDVDEEGGLVDMIEAGQDIGRASFLRKVDRAEMAEISEQLGYGPHLRMKDDYHVRYYRSTLHGQPVVYFKWSAIEYVFVPPGFRAGVRDRENAGADEPMLAEGARCLVELEMNPAVRLPARDLHFRARHGGGNPPVEPPPDEDGDDDEGDEPDRVLLAGADSEGESREMWVGTSSQIPDVEKICQGAKTARERAMRLGDAMLISDEHGPGWRSYEVWWNNPSNGGKWEAVAAGPNPIGEGARCRHRVSRQTTRTCSRPATVQRGGKGYCSRHDPDKAHSSAPLDGRRKFRWMAERLIEGVHGEASGLYRAPDDPSVEHIVAAAIKCKMDGEVYLGDGHAEAVDYANDEHGKSFSGPSYTTGFVTSSGRFVGREEAMRIARASRQHRQVPTGRSSCSHLDSAEVRTDVEESREDDYPYAAADFLERVATERYAMVREFAARLKANGLKGLGRISWSRIPAEPLSRIWLVYGKRGTVFDEEAVDKIADQAMTLMARLYASTEISGHSQHDVRPECEEDLGRPFTEEEWGAFLGMLEDEKGNYLLSDFAWRWLQPLYEKLHGAKTAEQRLLIVDRILNVVHQRSDLAAIFVQGGQSTLSKIANQGGHATPDEEHEQGRALQGLPPKEIT